MYRFQDGTHSTVISNKIDRGINETCEIIFQGKKSAHTVSKNIWPVVNTMVLYPLLNRKSSICTLGGNSPGPYLGSRDDRDRDAR